MTPDPLYDAENDAKLLMRAAATVEAQQDRIDALEAALSRLRAAAQAAVDGFHGWSGARYRSPGRMEMIASLHALASVLHALASDLASLPEQTREGGRCSACGKPDPDAIHLACCAPTQPAPAETAEGEAERCPRCCAVYVEGKGNRCLFCGAPAKETP